MYINLILGGIALFAVWLLLRKLLVREDAPAGSDVVGDAAKMLEAELQKRRAGGADPHKDAAFFERMREAAAEHLRPVAQALGEMHSALPQQIPDTLRREEKGDSLDNHIAGTPQKADHSLCVVWLVPNLNLDDPRSGSGVYVLRDMHSKQEETAVDLKDCIRNVAAFIADALA